MPLGQLNEAGLEAVGGAGTSRSDASAKHESRACHALHDHGSLPRETFDHQTTCAGNPSSRPS
eukprot:7009281-Lingulodinium_polyedra.AAC.1